MCVILQTDLEVIVKKYSTQLSLPIYVFNFGPSFSECVFSSCSLLHSVRTSVFYLDCFVNFLYSRLYLGLWGMCVGELGYTE